MNTKMKMRLLSLLLCFVMLVVLMPTTVFAAGGGTSEATAIEVTDYASFKAAMEDPAILFVKISNTLSSTISSETGNLIVGASVSSNKTLIVNADATFTASGVAGKDIVDSLIQTVNGASLTIKGTGTLRFKANGNNSFNAVVRIDRGTVYVQDSVTLHGTYNNATYGCAILNQNGNLNLWGGTLRGEAGYYTNPNYLGAIDLRGGNTVINGNTVVIGNKYSGNSSAGEYPEKLVALTVEDDATLAIYEGAVNLTEGVTINNDSVSIAFADSKVTSDYLMSGIKMFRASTHEALATNYSKVHDSVYFAQTPANLFAVQPTFQIVSEGNSGTVSFTMNGNYTYSAVQLVKESGVADDSFATAHAGVHFSNTANVYTATEYKGDGTYQTPEGNYKIAVQISGEWYYSNVFAISYGTVQPTEYIVSYNANGGSGTMGGDMVEENGKFTLENCTYIAPEGYQFKAWAIGSVNGEQKQPGEQITITGETYIYAIWEDIPHKCVGVLESGQGATCTVDGWKDYYRCECGKYYEDENCTILISDLEAWKIGDGKIAAAHSGTPEWTKTATTHAKKYTCCDTFVVETEAHEWNNGVCSECEYVCLHSSTGSNVATCQHKAICDVCGVEYDELAEHNPASSWTSDASSHWHECSICGARTGESEHTLDEKGKCTECGFKKTILADVNGDGQIDTIDLTIMRKYLSGYTVEMNVAAADLNGDGKVDTIDLTLMRKYLAGYEVIFAQ